MKKYVCCFIFVFVCVSFSFTEDRIETVVRESASENESASISVITNVSGVEVYINKLYKGDAPFDLSNVVPGRYRIELFKEGYEEKSTTVDIKANTETSLYFELKPMIGFLRILSPMNDAEIYIDDVLLEDSSTDLLKLGQGEHTIECKKFGYKTEARKIFIVKDKLQELSIELHPDDLRVESLVASPEAFNPLGPSSFSMVNFSFSVTTPCTIQFEILDQNQHVVWSRQYQNLTKRDHSITWNGKNSYGQMLAEGSYSAVVKASPLNHDSTNNSITLVTTPIVIDSSIFYPIVTSASHGSTSGVSTARLMPKGTILLSVTGLADFSTQKGFVVAPFSLGMSFTPFNFSELSFHIGGEASDALDLPMFIGGTFKFAFPLQSFYLGGLIRYTYATEIIEMPSFSGAGLGVGFLAGLELGRSMINFCEEAVFGSEFGNVAKFDGYLKTGLAYNYQTNVLTTNAWASVFSPFTREGLKSFGLFEAGFEFLFMLPRNTIIPLVGCSYTYKDTNEHNIALRFGVNMLML